MPPAAIGIGAAAITDTEATVIPKPTTLPLDLNKRYLRCLTTDHTKHNWGTAAYAVSDFFKTPSIGKPKSKRWDHLLTVESKSRKPSTLKAAAQHLAKPGLISLGGGLPSSAYFPFDDMTCSVPVPPNFSEADTAQSSRCLVAGKYDLASQKSVFDISTAFNYGQGSGSAQLLRWVTEHTELVHNPPYADWGCNLTIGSTSAIDMALRMFATRGDYVIAEEYTFPAFVEACEPMGLKMAGVAMDDKGMVPSDLERLLATWNEADHDGAAKPRLLYTIPTGQNPTGATMGLQRRREIYAICQRHDVYILEDEPYYFLQMPDYGTTAAPASDHAAFLGGLVPSFLSFDVDGRVMRMDSFSKVIAPGSRVGWVTASEQIIERYRMHVDCSTQGPSGMSQLMLFKLLDEHWGHGGYLDWLQYIRQEYTQRRDQIVEACEKHLPADLVRWVPPKAGMFHWMEINWTKHPLAETWSLEEIEEQIFLESINAGALVTRSSWFFADSDKRQKRMFFRATYASAPADQIALAIERFGEGVRKVFSLNNSLRGTNGV